MKEIYKVCIEEVDKSDSDKFIWEIPLLKSI